MNDTEFFWVAHEPYSKEREQELSKRCEKLIKLTTLRCPVAHTRSIYLWSRRNHKLRIDKGKSIREPFANTWKLSFSDWIRVEERLPNFFHNWFLGRHPKMSEEEMISYISNIDYVIDTSNLKKQVNLMIQDLDEDLYFERHYGDSSNEYFEPSNEDIKLIKSIREKDYALIGKFNINEMY